MRLLFIFLLFIQTLSAQEQVVNAVSNFVKDPVNKNAKITFKVIDVETGKTIASHRPEQAIVGASTTKLFSTSSAFEILGATFQMKTRIYCDGYIDKDSILHGNVWIRGGGDVGMGSKFFSKENQELNFLNDWTDSLKRLGIKHIEGALIADASEFGYEGTPASWSSVDVGNYYGAFSGGLNFYDNTLKIAFKTAGPGTKPVFIETYPKVEGFQLKNQLVAGNVTSDQSTIHGDAFELNRSITGTIPKNSNYYITKSSLPDPEISLAQEWERVLLKNNIQVADGAKSVRLHFKEMVTDNKDTSVYNTKKLLFTIPSKSIQDIAYWTNLKSVNVFAEGILNAVSYYKTGDGSTTAAVKYITNYWSKKIDTKGLVLNDGSGLSRANAISANHFCALLSYMYKSKSYADFKATLPVVGKTGTVKGICTKGAAAGRIQMKSGTLKGVKAFAGYVYSSSGKTLAFSISVNNFTCSSETLVQKMEQLFNEMALY
jgi:D-alanyl-D-alanine carboxypeptidase/D-alanyl-D-alanine-endopeptidase (penicillin-binding protein 4)